MSLTATMQIMPIDALTMRESRATRRVVSADSTLRLMPGVAHDVIVEDFSTTGCRLRSSIPMTVGTRLRLALSGGGATVEADVVRLAPGGYGCVFAVPIPEETFAKAFSGETIIHAMFEKDPAAHDAPVAECLPDITPWPRPVRAVVMVGCGVGAWVLLGLVVGWL